MSVEINGKPAAKIKVWAEEKINVGNFSNVTFGAEVSVYVEDDHGVIMEQMRETLHDRVESFLAQERAELLAELTKDE